jgi:putative amino-acid transport system ATP-binding protein
MLKIKDISFSRGDTPILKNISFEVVPGQIVGFWGPSGCGKSTLLRCLAFLEQVDSGEILFGDMPLKTSHDINAYRKKIGFVFQDFGLWAMKTAIDNIVLPLCVVHGLSKEEAFFRAETTLTRLGIAHRKNAFPREMSGGEQQRLACARAIAVDPDLLILDEPSASLDSDSTQKIQEILREAREKNKTSLMATHDKKHLSLFDKLYIFENHTLKEKKEIDKL